MPFTFFSHQAAVLPLKLARPRWFSGTALAVGSMSPDFEYFFPVLPIMLDGVHWVPLHTVPGLFIHCLPYTLLFVWMIKRWIARPLASHLPDMGPFHLRDYAALEQTLPRTFYGWLVTVISALIGSFSHLLWDSFTHEGRWGVQEIPTLKTEVFYIGGYAIHGYRLLQHTSTLIGGLISLSILYYIGKNRLLLKWSGKPILASARLPLTSYFIFWGPPILLGLSGFMMGLNEQGMGENWESIRHWVNVFLRTTTGTTIGILIGSMIIRFQERTGRNKEERTVSNAP